LGEEKNEEKGSWQMFSFFILPLILMLICHLSQNYNKTKDEGKNGGKT